MHFIRFSILSASGLLLAACIPSVQPYYHPQDVMVDPALLGSWRCTQDSEWDQWTFAEQEDACYMIDVADSDGKTGRLIGHLFTLADRRYLDLTPESCDFPKTQHDVVSFAVFPGHLLARIDSVDDGFALSFFNWDWLKTHLTENPGALAHRTERDAILLTAETDALQRFVIAHAGNDELFKATETSVYRRVAAETTGSANSAAE